MAVRLKLIAAICFFCFAGLSTAQIVSFNTPIPWVSQRSDTITVRAQIDTAQMKKKSISMTLSVVSDGRQKKLATKNFPITDYSGEFTFGKIGKSLVGGFEYIKIDWNIPGTQEKGTLAPIGIADLEKLPALSPMPVARIAAGADAAAVASGAKDDRFMAIGNNSVAMAWNMDAFFLMVKKTTDTGSLRVVFDGKSGKNAFLSYPDRVVVYQPSVDSVTGVHFVRDLVNDSLHYREQKWQNDISKTTIGDKVVIRVPWYSTGVIPFEERTIGMGLFAFSSEGNVAAAMPSTAQFYIPATWGDILLEK